MHEQLRNFALIGLALFMAGCGTGPSAETDLGPYLPEGAKAIGYAAIDDNVRHDTLLIQTTFDLRDSTFIMVASNVLGKFEGLRLTRYRARPDSSAEVLAVSSPAYDSWTMLPYFFGPDSTDTNALWVLTNFGERESWGLKVMRLDVGFTDMGFMDIALPERMMEDDSIVLKRRDIGRMVRWSEHNDTSYFRFACDSVYLYDDLAGNVDRVVPSRSVHYTHHRDTGLELWFNGQRRSKAKGDS